MEQHHDIIRRVAEAHRQVLEDTVREVMPLVPQAAEIMADSLAKGGKILFCGNGGSAADSQHLAAELVGRFVKERRGLASVALTTDTSILTAVANDYGYDRVFARQVEALGRPGDVLVGISTSGNSPNVVAALRCAKELGLRRIGMTGMAGGEVASLSELCLRVPSRTTARVQEMHILLGHMMCEMIDEVTWGDPQI